MDPVMQYLIDAQGKVIGGSPIIASIMGQPPGSPEVAAASIAVEGRALHPAFNDRALLDWSIAVAADQGKEAIPSPPLCTKIANWLVSTGLANHPGPLPVDLRQAVAEAEFEAGGYASRQLAMEAMIALAWS